MAGDPTRQYSAMIRELPAGERPRKRLSDLDAVID